MISMLATRLTSVILVMLVVTGLSFCIFNFLGDPVNNVLGVNATLAQREELRAALGLDQPTIVQFWRFVERAAVGDFGVSYRNRQPVLDLILTRLPATLELVFAATLTALLVGIPMGVYTALRPRGLLSRLFQMGSLLGISMPQFLIGMLLILVFSVELRWLSAFGRGDTVRIGWWTTGFLTVSGLKALIMPTITLAVFQVSMIMRLIRGEMLEVLRSDFIKFARARGLSDRAVHLTHALRNSLLPVITIVGLQIGSLIAFAIVVEAVFQWPGMGLLILQAIEFADFPVMAAYLAFVGFSFVLINLIVDLTYLLVDPRLRVK
ncbi:MULTISPECIES: ABC transporter permease [Labrys]|uniref:ABC transporter permease n=1 Tax=Labrys TaxID=204476 RepID=UPI000836A92D|nr:MULTISPECIES: ABC transporter permease [unclassified Labrys (in: a-proteobacteria)]MDZ5451149.1 ABC transporter permease [Labrys sp. ZIDIC5]OCC00418.1 ABC transporter permease [Labrys sp. WJW]